MVVNSCYFLVVVLVCFPSLGFADVCGEISVACVLWVQLASLGWGFLSNTFCRAGFVGSYSLNLCLSWNILFPLLMVIESLLGIVVWACIPGFSVSAAHQSRTSGFHGFQ